MILDEIHGRVQDLTLLDIGCGRGFDGDAALQEALAARCNRYIGIEPDASIRVGDYLPEVLRCGFEDSPLPPDSVDVAFAVMVLEHLAEPDAFWAKLHSVLRDGGTFWGFTVDARHFFAWLSRSADILGLKGRYLSRLLGQRGSERHEDYPTFYRANTPKQIARQTGRFRRFDFITLLRVGEIDYCIPRWLRPVAHVVDRIMMALGLPGSTLAIRVEK